MRKRVMSLVLAAVMLLGLAPAALADSERSPRDSHLSASVSQLRSHDTFTNRKK